MYRIDRAENRIEKVPEASFSQLSIMERHHIQEWLAYKPDALGEELLVIQKEFDGFDDTNERLDLLAIDKGGNLVIIEIKRDDSGRDVVWQAIKYASYCSTLSKTQIADVYQAYLNKHFPGKQARDLICAFLGREGFDEVVLNPGNDQRLILVARTFRKEVTSTALWLLKHRINLKCFRATPYECGKELFLTLEQVIPLPEAEDLMIGIAEKEVEEQVSERGQAAGAQIRMDFWLQALSALRASSSVHAFKNVRPGKHGFMDAGSGIGGIRYTLIYKQKEVRVQLTIGRDSKEFNKTIFDFLYAQKDAIEADFGLPLEWRRMDEDKMSLIVCSAQYEGLNRQLWPAMIEWLIDRTKRMERVFNKRQTEVRLLIGRMSENDSDAARETAEVDED